MRLRFGLAWMFAAACASGGSGPPDDAAPPDRILVVIPDGAPIDSVVPPHIDASVPDATAPPIDAVPTVDAAPPDATVPVPDAAPPDATPPPSCDVPPTFGALGALSGGATSIAGPSGSIDLIYTQPLLDATTTPDVLSLELYRGYGAFTTGNIVPGTYTISGAELDYATCGVCLLIHANFDSTTGTVTETYMATGGTIELTSVSGNLVGTITGATLEHVTIDPMTFTSTPVGDGCTTAIDSASFDMPITAM